MVVNQSQTHSICGGVVGHLISSCYMTDQAWEQTSAVPSGIQQNHTFVERNGSACEERLWTDVDHVQGTKVMLTKVSEQENSRDQANRSLY